MCRLIVAANRDEYYDRPTAPAAFRDDAPHLLAGRDLRSGGAWLGVTRTGRIAAITNYREPGREKRGAPSRGLLVTGFLTGSVSVDDYLLFLQREGGAYNGFSLIFGDPGRLVFFSNRGKGAQALEPGIHGLSNHLLDTAWPKVNRGRKALARIVADEETIRPDGLFAVLADRTIAPDGQLPDTGVGIELERLLSPLFTTTPVYGTRCSTVILIGREGEITFIEKTYDGQPEETRTVSFRFRMGEAEGIPSA